MNIDDAFVLLIMPVREGGYQDGAGDPGGETNYGIAAASHPGVDIKNLTQAQAKLIYLKEYWGPAGCDNVPDSIKFDLFDAAVNSGVSEAVKFLQLAVNCVPDGQMGPLTLQAVNSAAAGNTMRLLVKMTANRQAHDSELKNAHTAGPAWMRRIAANMIRW